MFLLKRQNDDLNAARGTLNGLLLSLFFWAIVASIVFFLVSA